MRDYAIVSPYFWLGSTGKMVRGRKNAQVLAFYLLTCPSSNMLGMYYLPIPTMVHETGLTEDEVMAALDLLSTPDLPVDNHYIEAPSKPHQSPSEAPPKGLPRISHAPSMPHQSPLEGAYCRVFSLYDPISEYVFIPKMATFQVGESLKTGDKRIAGIEKELKRLQKCPFYHLFMKLYARKYHLSTETVDNFEVKAPSMPLARAFDAPSMPHRSQDQDQDQDQEQEQEKSPPTPLFEKRGEPDGGRGVDNLATPTKDSDSENARTAAAYRILRLLNHLGRKDYPVDDPKRCAPFVDVIAARLEDYAESDLRAMVKQKCEEWGHSVEKKRWLKIGTLFSPVNCGDYVASLRRKAT